MCLLLVISDKEVIFSPVDFLLFVGLFVAWSVSLSVGLHKNFRTDCHVTWVEDGSWPE